MEWAGALDAPLTDQRAESITVDSSHLQCHYVHDGGPFQCCNGGPWSVRTQLSWNQRETIQLLQLLYNFQVNFFSESMWL